MHFARVFGAQPALPKAHIVTVETDMTKGLHAFAIVGLPDKSVTEARDRIASAIKNTETDGEPFKSPKSMNKKIVVSLAPAELKKEGAVFDVPAALSYLLASKQIKFEPRGKLFAGELTLDGKLRPIRGALSIAKAAKEEGFKEIYIPAENASEASLVSEIAIFPIGDLAQLVRHLSGESSIKKYTAGRSENVPHVDFETAIDDIRGQESAKRALEIATAGRHNIALYGPPGTGKTMLARAAAALLPELSEDEAIEVTTIHSLAGTLSSASITHAPFRSPHHTSSYAAIIGGGTVPRPGEVTLAHRGVLFLDEFPEFHRDVVNALREPLEDKVVSVARAKSSAVFPANFMLIAALNPCPCGFWGTERCECMPHLVEKYRRKFPVPSPTVSTCGSSPRFRTDARAGETPLGETRAARSASKSARSTKQAFFRRNNAYDERGYARQRHRKLAGLSDKAEATLLEAAKRMKPRPAATIDHKISPHDRGPCR